MLTTPKKRPMPQDTGSERPVVDAAQRVASKAVFAEPEFDNARPGCLLCNPEPGKRYLMRRPKLIAELSKPRWKYSVATVTKELCEHCIEEYRVLDRLMAHEKHEADKKAARAKQEHRTLVESPCEICGHHWTRIEDLNRRHCRFCAMVFDETTLLQYAIEHSGTITFFRTEGGDLILRLTLEEVRMDFTAEAGFTSRFWAKVRRTIREKLPHLPETEQEQRALEYALENDRWLLGDVD